MFIIISLINSETYLYKLKSTREAQFVPGFLSIFLKDNADVRLTNVPQIFGEYQPYTTLKTLEELLSICLSYATNK